MAYFTMMTVLGSAVNSAKRRVATSDTPCLVAHQIDRTTDLARTGGRKHISADGGWAVK